MALSEIVREIDPLTGEFISSGASAQLTNFQEPTQGDEREFSHLKSQVSFMNTRFELILGDAATGLMSSFRTVATLRIANWSFRGRMANLIFNDRTQDRFKKKLTEIPPSTQEYAFAFTDRDHFPWIPEGTNREIVPIILGEFYTNSPAFPTKGAFKATLVDPAVGQPKYRYILAQNYLHAVTTVYFYGVRQHNPGTVVHVVQPDGNTWTYLDVDTDVRATGEYLNPEQRSLPEVTFDACGGPLAATNGVEKNPRRQLKYFLEKWGGSWDGSGTQELDESTWDGEASRDNRHQGVLYVTDKEETLGSIVAKWSESFNGVVYHNRNAALAVWTWNPEAMAGDIDSAPLFEEGFHIIEGSFHCFPLEAGKMASQIRYFYGHNSVVDKFETDSLTVDRGESFSIGDANVEPQLQWYIRDPITGYRTAHERVHMRREMAHYAEWEMPIELFDQVELNQIIKVSHTEGVGDLAGWVHEVCRVIGIRIVPSDDSFVVHVTAQHWNMIRISGLEWWQYYAKLGDETLIAATWGDATDADKQYLYLGDEETGTLGDGDPIKRLI